MRWPIALVASVYIACALWLPDGGFWINDNGLKFIQVEGLLRPGPTSFAIDWPGAAIDPSYRFGPITRGFRHISDGEVYAAYSPFFALLSAVPFRAFGLIGLYLLPLLGGLLSLWAVQQLAGMVCGEARDASRIATLAVLGVGLATPLWFYSLTFWEHAPAVALGCWCVVFCLRYRAEPTPRRAALTGLLAALPIYLRTDAYLFAAVCLLAAWLGARRRTRDAAILGGALFAALVPLWVLHWVTVGNPLGPHVASQGWGEIEGAAYLARRFETLGNLLVAGHRNPWWSAAAFLPFALAGLARLRFEAGRRPSAVPIAAAGGLFAGLVVMAGHLGAAHPMNWLLSSNGLFASTPICILALLPSSGASTRLSELVSDASASAQRARATLFGIALGYAGLFAALVPEVNSQGIHWGNRFLLPVYPILAVLAAERAATWWRHDESRHWPSRVALIALFSLTVGMQVYSLALLHDRKQFTSELNDRVGESNADIVVVDTWFLPVDLARVFHDTPIFLCPPEQRPRLFAAATKAGAHSALLVDRWRSDARNPGSIALSDGWLRFSPVQLREVELEPSANKEPSASKGP